MHDATEPCSSEFDYEYALFREHIRRWLYKRATPDMTKEYLRSSFPEPIELEWKHVRFYESLAYLEALLKQNENELSDYWYCHPLGVDHSYLSGYLVLAVWTLMAHMPDKFIGEYPSLKEVEELARSYWMGAIANVLKPEHTIGPLIEASGPPRMYQEGEFVSDLVHWMPRHFELEEFKRYFRSKYPDESESLWRLRRLLAALHCLWKHDESFPEFEPGEAPLLMGLWRYFSTSPHENLNEPDVETIRLLALSERKRHFQPTSLL